MEFIYSFNELDAAANWLKAQVAHTKIICFNAEMGAGKTTLIKAFCKQFGVTDPMNSPSFGIVNEYHGSNQTIIYHFDLYRIKNIEELYSIGFEEYLNSGKICLIEWPQIAEFFLNQESIAIVEIAGTGNERTLKLHSHN